MNLLTIIKTDNKNISNNKDTCEVVNEINDDKSYNKDNYLNLLDDLKVSTMNYKSVELDFDNNKAKSFDHANLNNNMPLRKQLILTNEKYIQDDKTTKPLILMRQKSMPENMNYNIYSGLVKGKFL